MAAAPRSSWELSSPKKLKGNSLEGIQGFCLSIQLCKTPGRRQVTGKVSFQEDLQNSYFQTFLSMSPKSCINCVYWQACNIIVTAAAPLLHSCLFDRHHSLFLAILPSWKETCYGADRRICRKTLSGFTKAVYTSRIPVPPVLELFDVENLSTDGRYDKPPCKYLTQLQLWYCQSLVLQKKALPCYQWHLLQGAS